MAIVILGGLITATLLNLFVVPVLYLHFAKGARTSEVACPLPPDAGITDGRGAVSSPGRCRGGDLASRVRLRPEPAGEHV